MLPQLRLHFPQLDPESPLSVGNGELAFTVDVTGLQTFAEAYEKTIPLGTLAGGALATWIGLRETIAVGAVGGGFAFLWLLFSPQRHLREMPEPIADDVATETALEEALPSVRA